MITVLHGDDIPKSRDYIQKLREQFKSYEFYLFEGVSTQEADIIQVFEAKSLFEEPKLILLQNFIQTKNKTLLASVFNHLKKNPEHEVIVWESKPIKKELFPFFPKDATILEFKINQATFQFLDAIRPNNVKQLLELYSTILEHEGSEFVFFMMLRQFRILLALSDSRSSKQIDEVKRLQVWQKSKLEKQAQYFSKKRLLELYQQLFEIERGMKTSSLTLPMRATLEEFIINL